MATLIFFAVILALVIILAKVVVNIFRGQPYKSLLWKVIYLLTGYLLIWLLFYFQSGYKSIPYGEDVCFDDWCISVTHIDTASIIDTVKPTNKFYILHLKLSNKARGIAQKPSEPRIHVIDRKGNEWNASIVGQQALEKLRGKQAAIDKRLELNETTETQLVFDAPKQKGLKILIEEGPFITKLLLNEDKAVFNVPYP